MLEFLGILKAKDEENTSAFKLAENTNVLSESNWLW